MRAPRIPVLRRPAAAAIGVALTVALTLGGCSGDDAKGSAGEESAASGEAKGSDTAGREKSDEKGDEAGKPVLGKPGKGKVPEFVGVQHELPSGKALKNVPDLYEQVALTGCEATSDGWQASGTAGNKANAERTLRVLVFFTDAQARIVDSASTPVTMPAGGSADWTAEREFAAPEGTLCLVRAVTREK